MAPGWPPPKPWWRRDAQVARQLLSYYASQGDLPARLRTATTAFATWPDQFADYVLTSLAVEQAPTLYPAALRHRTLANHSLDDFAALRPLLSEAETTALVREAVAATARRGSVAFAAELLARTADVAGLRAFVLGLEWLHVSPPYHAEIALMRLAEVDPTPLMLELETCLPAYPQRPRRGQARGVSLRAHRPLAGECARDRAPPHRPGAAPGPGAAHGVSDVARAKGRAAARGSAGGRSGGGGEEAGG